MTLNRYVQYMSHRHVAEFIHCEGTTEQFSWSQTVVRIHVVRLGHLGITFRTNVTLLYCRVTNDQNRGSHRPPPERKMNQKLMTFVLFHAVSKQLHG